MMVSRVPSLALPDLHPVLRLACPARPLARIQERRTSPRRTHARIPDRGLTAPRATKKTAGQRHDRVFEPNKSQTSGCRSVGHRDGMNSQTTACGCFRRRCRLEWSAFGYCIGWRRDRAWILVNRIDDFEAVRELADVLVRDAVAGDRFFKTIRSSRAGQNSCSVNTPNRRPLASAYARTCCTYRSPLVSRRTTDAARSRSPRRTAAGSR